MTPLIIDSMIDSLIPTNQMRDFIPEKSCVCHTQDTHCVAKPGLNKLIQLCKRRKYVGTQYEGKETHAIPGGSSNHHQVMQAFISFKKDTYPRLELSLPPSAGYKPSRY